MIYYLLQKIKKTSEIVAKNLNTLHQARQNYIKSEFSSKIKQVLNHQVRTYSDVIYNTGDLVSYKRRDNLTVLTWKNLCFTEFSTKIH